MSVTDESYVDKTRVWRTKLNPDTFDNYIKLLWANEKNNWNRYQMKLQYTDTMCGCLN